MAGQIDIDTRLSAAQAITATAFSTYVYDLQVARAIGAGRPLYVQSVVNVAFTDSGSDSTITVDLCFSNTKADVETGGTPTKTQRVGILAALAAIGDHVEVEISPVYKYRYMSARYTTTGGDLTTGSITTDIVPQLQNTIHYPVGHTVAS
jgi:hypothetical protein